MIEKKSILDPKTRSDVGDRKGYRRGNVIVFSLLGLAALIAIAVVGGGQAFKAYDSAHPIDVTCEVRSAKASAGGSTSSRGVGTLFDQVEIKTDDCGALVLRRGVTAQNKDDVARELKNGGRVEFRIGAASYKWREVLRVLRTPVIVNSYASPT